MNWKLNTKLVQATSPINPVLGNFFPAPGLVHGWGFAGGEFSHPLLASEHHPRGSQGDTAKALQPQPQPLQQPRGEQTALTANAEAPSPVLCALSVCTKASPKGGICLVWTSSGEKLSAPRVLSYSLV